MHDCRWDSVATWNVVEALLWGYELDDSETGQHYEVCYMECTEAEE